MSARTILAATLSTVVLTAFAAAAQDQTVQRSFKAGGSVYLDLSAGEYRISGSPDDRIHVTAHPTSKHAASETDVHIDVNAAGTKATVLVDGPFNDGVNVDIQVPRRSDLIADLSAGELTLTKVDGSKDISANAGELTIEVGNRDQYRNVSASVRIGELRVRPFNVTKEGFFRSFEWGGKGSYDLRIKLMVGELTLN